MIPLLAATDAAEGPAGGQIAVVVAIFVAVTAIVYCWWPVVREFIRRQEEGYERVLRGHLLLDIKPRTVTILSLAAMFTLGVLTYVVAETVVLATLFAAGGVLLPTLMLKYLRSRRLYRLEDQLVDGVRTLASGVRAGLNLVQAMELLAHNAVRPMCEEFGHLIREYEHGVSLEHAMENAAKRIGSPNYRLVFSALLTHRERGGDLGETLDRIAESIREIHRLEKRIETLTAPGRTAAVWMAAMPAVILFIFYFISPQGVTLLFTDPIGRSLLLVIVLLNVLGFLWIRKIVNVDI